MARRGERAGDKVGMSEMRRRSSVCRRAYSVRRVTDLRVADDPVVNGDPAQPKRGNVGISNASSQEQDKEKSMAYDI